MDNTNRTTDRKKGLSTHCYTSCCGRENRSTQCLYHLKSNLQTEKNNVSDYHKQQRKCSMALAFQSVNRSFIRTHMHACTYIPYICRYAHTHTFTHTHTCTHAHRHTHTHAHTHTQCMHAHTHTHTRTHTHTQTHTQCMHAHTHTHAHPHPNTHNVCMHTHTHTYARTHTHKHTHSILPTSNTVNGTVQEDAFMLATSSLVAVKLLTLGCDVTNVTV